MNYPFDCLDDDENRILAAVVHQRDPLLAKRIARDRTVSRADAETIVTILNDELLNTLGEDWEPTAYGQAVSHVLTRVNNARIDMWE